MSTLSWLHLSDLHACTPKFGWDAGRVLETLVADLDRLQREHGLRPDLIFFTGDAAWGEFGTDGEETIAGQFECFARFLEEVRRVFVPEIELKNVLLVPGNHDVNRTKVTKLETSWLDQQKALEPVREIIHEGGLVWRRYMEGLGDYRAFLEGHGFDHLLVDDRERLIYATVRRVGGLRVGIAGFNSAWSCCQDREKRKLWMAGKWQQGVLRAKLREADFAIALMHHPPGWVVDYENPDFERGLEQDFRFLLHGHEHQAWVQPGAGGYTVLAAAACYERSESEHNGYSMVQLDPETGRGEVWLRRFDTAGGDWIPRIIAGRTNDHGLWTLDLPSFRPDGVGKTPSKLPISHGAEKTPATEVPNDSMLTENRQTTNFMQRQTSITDYDANALTEYREDLRHTARAHLPDTLSPEEFLGRMQCREDGKMTVAGVLLFTRCPRLEVVPTAKTECTVFHGTDKSGATFRDRRSLEGSVPQQIKKAYDFLLTHVGVGEVIRPESPQTKVIYDYPMGCLRELVANALCHRDYQDDKRMVHLEIYGNRIEILSPGPWVGKSLSAAPPVKLSELIVRAPVQRNPELAWATARIRLVEGIARGLPFALKDCKEQDCPEPEVIHNDGYVIVTVFPNRRVGAELSARRQEFGDALPQYMQRLRAAHRDLPVAGFETRVRLPIRLDQVFVPLRARVYRTVMESERKECGTFQELPPETGGDRDLEFDDSLRVATEYALRGAVVLGDPGSGKTTLLKHFVLAATDPTLGPAVLGLPRGTIPLFIELRLGHPAAGLKTALREAVARADVSLDGADASAFAEELLRRDQLLLLLDGLDEVPGTAERAAVSRWIEEAITQLPGSTFVVTSRYSGYRGDARLTGHFLELHVRDLSEEAARSFIRAWYQAVESQPALEREAEVAAAMAQKASGDLADKIFDLDDPRTSSLRLLATNPLMLQILCLVHRDRKTLPEKRVELYRECVLVLLELWRRAKGMPPDFLAHEALRLLQPLAYWLHVAERKEAQVEEIVPHLEESLRELRRQPEDGGRFLQAIRDQSGVLVSLGQGAYGFLHLSFQEYLCARHVQDQAIEEPAVLRQLAEHFGEPWWREVILLAMGLDNPSLFKPLMEQFLKLEVLHRDVRLADDCLRDALQTTPQPFLKALERGVANPAERYHVLRLLRALPTWEKMVLRDNLPARNLVDKLARGDADPQVRGMAAELLGGGMVERVAGEVQAPAAKLTFLSPREQVHEKDGTVLVYVPRGAFTLGDDDIHKESRPIHTVRLSPFWIGKYPVTNEQYRRYLKANPDRPEPRFWDDKEFNQPQQPVVGVSWNEAVAYCWWAGLELPSEAQWEAAARGEDQRRYPWGNVEPNASLANFDRTEGKTMPVGSYPGGAGPYGTLDQAGNVLEWCADVWDARAYRGREGQLDPVVTSGDDAAVRVARGGSWENLDRGLAAASRFTLGAELDFSYFGFRCVLPIDPDY